MNLRAQATYFSDDGKKRYNIQLLKKDYIGDVATLNPIGHVVETGRQNSTEYETILPTNISFRFYVETEAEQAILTDIFAAPEDTYRLRFREGSETFIERMTLTVVNDYYEESYRPLPYAAEIRATCGLQRLSNIDFEPAGVMDMFAILRQCIQPIQKGFGFAITDPVSSGEVASNEASMQLDYFDTVVYQGYSNLDVLRAILGPKLLRIELSGGRWQIRNFFAASKDSAEYEQKLFSADGVHDITTTGYTARSFNEFSPTPSRRLTSPAKEVAIRYDLDEGIESMESEDFTLFPEGVGSNGTTPFRGWAFESGTFEPGFQVVHVFSTSTQGPGRAMLFEVPYSPIGGPDPDTDNLPSMAKGGYQYQGVANPLRLLLNLKTRWTASDGAQGPLNPCPFYVQIGIEPDAGAKQYWDGEAWGTTATFEEISRIPGRSYNISAHTDTIPVAGRPFLKIVGAVDTNSNIDGTERTLSAFIINEIDFYVTAEDGSIISLDYVEYTAVGDNNTRRIQLPAVRHGDGPAELYSYPGAIGRFDGTLFIRSENNWSFYDIENKFLLQLATEVIQNYRDDAKSIIRGSGWLGNLVLFSHSICEIDASRYVATYYRFDAKRNNIVGEWQLVASPSSDNNIEIIEVPNRIKQRPTPIFPTPARIPSTQINTGGGKNLSEVVSVFGGRSIITPATGISENQIQANVTGTIDIDSDLGFNPLEYSNIIINATGDTTIRGILATPFTGQSIAFHVRTNTYTVTFKNNDTALNGEQRFYNKGADVVITDDFASVRYQYFDVTAFQGGWWLVSKT